MLVVASSLTSLTGRLWTTLMELFFKPPRKLWLQVRYSVIHNNNNCESRQTFETQNHSLAPYSDWLHPHSASAATISPPILRSSISPSVRWEVFRGGERNEAEPAGVLVESSWWSAFPKDPGRKLGRGQQNTWLHNVQLVASFTF